jgi:hypothetical protein
MKKTIFICLVYLLLLVAVRYATNASNIDNETDTKRPPTPLSSTITFQGHWWVNSNGWCQYDSSYEKNGTITVTVSNVGLWEIIGIGTMNGAWSISDESESGTLSGRFFTEWLLFYIEESMEDS